jgi:undecaprenyl diphosphate synthase
MDSTTLSKAVGTGHVGAPISSPSDAQVKAQINAPLSTPVDSPLASLNPAQRAARTAAALASLGLPAEALPKHIAVIMDGNGRWAQRQGQPRIFGHERGARTVRAIVTQCATLGIEVLTLYSFSMENWKRPADEVAFLMELYVRYLIIERDELMANNVRFVQIGQRQGLPEKVLDELDRTIEMTASNTGLTLVLAINYSSRQEITDAVRAIAQKVRDGQLDAKLVTQQTVSEHLYTAGLPDPDLLVRTAGEMRVSNYLLWQISYAELYVADVCWPDFDAEQLNLALHAFAKRTRRFGGVVE